MCSDEADSGCARQDGHTDGSAEFVERVDQR
jgi:hypothetical protein